MNKEVRYLVVSAVVLMNSGAIAASTPSVIRITNNGYCDRSPQIAGSHVVWQGYADGDWEIFHYDFDSGITTRVTDNSTHDLDPQTDGTYITWLGDGAKVNYYNIALGGPITTITSVTAPSGPPQIADGKITWATGDVAVHSEVHLYDIATLTYSNLSAAVDPSNSYDDVSPRINSTMVGWSQTDIGDVNDLTDDVSVFIIHELGGATYVAPEGFIWPDSPQSSGGG